MVGLRPYPVYRDVGLPWLEQVPKHWQLRRGKNLLRCIDERSQSGDEELLTVSSTRGVVPRRTATVTMFEAESYSGHKLCWPGDLVINSLWAWAGGLGVSQHHGIVSTAYGVYRLREGSGASPAFIHNLVRSVRFQWELQVRSKGVWTSRLQLTDQSFLGAPLPLPPPEEQDAIVRYLNYMDRRIRRYIGAKQKLIILLEEQKRAIIHKAVTHGLDPGVHLKPSGVEWLGDVPEHWEVLPLRRAILSAIDGPHFSPEYLDAGVPFLSARNVKADGWDFTDVKYISDEDFEEFSKRTRPVPGDVLYTKGGTTGVAHVVDLTFPFQVWVHVAVLKVDRKRLNPEFLALVLNSPRCYEQSQLLTRGATNQDLGLGRMKSIGLPVPPLPEQIEIAKYVRTRATGVLDGISQNHRQIAIIQEYRTRMIADVVTGKLDVREVAANLPDEAEVAAGQEEESLEAIDQGSDDFDLEEAFEEVEA